MRVQVVMLSDLKVALHSLSFGDSQVDLVPVLSWVSNTDRSTSSNRQMENFLLQNKNVDANRSSGTTQVEATLNTATY